jgi:site-specific recombinase XerD
MYLRRASEVIDFNITGEQVQRFLNSRQCTNGGKHSYYRCLHTFYCWLYSPKSGFNLNTQDNPMLIVEAPKVEKKVLPSLVEEQVDRLLEEVESTRNKAIMSLFASSGLRLRELANIKLEDVDFEHRLIKIRRKGNKEGYATFDSRSDSLLRQWLAERGNNHNDYLWDIRYWGINTMLRRLMHETGLPCNAHTFRRTFASNLHRKGLDVEHIMRLGGWESLDMVLRYTRSVKFEDSLKLYRQLDA